MSDEFDNLPDESVEAPKKPSPALDNLMKKPPTLMKLGLGAPVMAMREEGATPTEIAAKLEVPKAQVTELVTAVEALPPADKPVVDHSLRNTSVFAVFDRLEELFEDTMRMSKMVEENPLLYKDYLGVRLQTLKLVKDCQKDEMVTKQRDDEFNLIIEEIGKESQECQQRIMKRIQQLRASRGLIKGF